MTIVERFKEIGTENICPVIALMKDGKVLSGLRHYTPDKWKSVSVWTFPGGRCDGKETIEATLRREVAEETAINDFVVTRYLGEVPGAKEGDIVYMYLATTQQEPQLLEPEKFSEWRWFDPFNLPKNFINPAALKLLQQQL